MNVNMVEHQRSILAVLGIDLWVPKTDVPVRAYNSSLYRDQAESEVSHYAELNHFNTVALAEKAPLIQENASKNEVSLLLKKVDQTQVEYVTTEVPVESALSDISDVQSLYLDPFTLQACAFENCVIVVDVTNMTQQQIALWNNIQNALSGQYQELKWPFALSVFQDGRGAHVYVQGFLDAMSADKKIITLGKLPHFNHQDVIISSTLQEMLDDPQLKRQLWQMMRS